MQLRCTRNNSKGLDEITKDHLSKYIRVDNHESYLEVGQSYAVFGIKYLDNRPWYYVYEEHDDPFPKIKPSCFFEIIDHAVDPSWRVAPKTAGGSGLIFDLLPREWLEDKFFYERLVDGEPFYEEAMSKIRERFESSLKST